MLTIGLIVNPFAGIGGSVALKGSDGATIREEALARGAQPLASARTMAALQRLSTQARLEIEFLAGSGPMGADILTKAGLRSRIVREVPQPSEPEHTQTLVKDFIEQNVDLILFAGGDGTARDVLSALEQDTPVLGIPAGCKIHSGVYAVTPAAAGLVINEFVNGKLLSLREGSVMDIDEDAFRSGVVRARNFGALTVPDALQYVQATKQGGKEVEELVLDDIAADIIEGMDNDVYYAIGSGSTCAHIMAELGLPNTLLGVDLIKNNQLIASDLTAQQLLKFADQALDDRNSSSKIKMHVVITLIGGQGHIIGRGNQQLSPTLIRKVGWENFTVVATKAKLLALEGRPLIVDSGDPQLDLECSGSKRIITGYHDEVIYHVGLEAAPTETHP